MKSNSLSKKKTARTTEPNDLPKKSYHKPRLEKYGDIRDVTMGTSPGLIDSGGMGKLQGL